MKEEEEVQELVDLYKDLNDLCKNRLKRNFDEILLFLTENQKLCDNERKEYAYITYIRLVTILKDMSLGAMQSATSIHEDPVH